MKKNLQKLNRQNMKIKYSSSENWKFKHVQFNKRSVGMYSYPDVKFKFSNKMINEDNMLYGFDLSDENSDFNKNFIYKRVMQGLFPMAILCEQFEENLCKYVEQTDKSKFDMAIYRSPSNGSTLFIYPKGTIGELFDLKSFEEDLKNCGMPVHIKNYEHLSILKCYEKFFLNNNIIDSNTKQCLSCLIYGIPIENMIAQHYGKFYVDIKLIS